jgi:hypothetical protein
MREGEEGQSFGFDVGMISVGIGDKLRVGVGSGLCGVAEERGCAVSTGEVGVGSGVCGVAVGRDWAVCSKIGVGESWIIWPKVGVGKVPLIGTGCS